MAKNELFELKTEIDTLKNELNKCQFHHSCLIYLIGELRNSKKLKSPVMQEVCVLFDLSNSELKVMLKNIQNFNGDLNKFIQDTLNALNKTISEDGLFFIIKGIKNSTSGQLKRSCQKLLKLYKKQNKKRN